MSKFIIRQNNRTFLNETVFHLTKGNMLTLKIDGLNSNARKHLKFQSNKTLRQNFTKLFSLQGQGFYKLSDGYFK
ncbi:hypothetical protein [Xenorhabdus hominickii]|uniref:Uncharacterized protein n=1 Tax=Xenorhabdus hominickii TaxID=351679 RepID=A0A2G0QF58_XENHO|nr:hypothetical protein [Xenorhabdus hominickii]AOM41872.1 hypothetical protein A9255_15695 [Xenorhabdus hominickii]PHM57844.1 hypothetical protein Xhom_00847 [Xenorhabdus hominickii]